MSNPERQSNIKITLHNSNPTRLDFKPTKNTRPSMMSEVVDYAASSRDTRVILKIKDGDDPKIILPRDFTSILGLPPAQRKEKLRHIAYMMLNANEVIIDRIKSAASPVDKDPDISPSIILFYKGELSAQDTDRILSNLSEDPKDTMTIVTKNGKEQTEHIRDLILNQPLKRTIDFRNKLLNEAIFVIIRSQDIEGRVLRPLSQTDGNPIDRFIRRASALDYLDKIPSSRDGE